MDLLTAALQLLGIIALISIGAFISVFIADLAISLFDDSKGIFFKKNRGNDIEYNEDIKMISDNQNTSKNNREDNSNDKDNKEINSEEKNKIIMDLELNEKNKKTDKNSKFNNKNDLSEVDEDEFNPFEESNIDLDSAKEEKKLIKEFLSEKNDDNEKKRILDDEEDNDTDMDAAYEKLQEKRAAFKDVLDSYLKENDLDVNNNDNIDNQNSVDLNKDDEDDDDINVQEIETEEKKREELLEQISKFEEDVDDMSSSVNFDDSNPTKQSISEENKGLANKIDNEKNDLDDILKVNEQNLREKQDESNKFEMPEEHFETKSEHKIDGADLVSQMEELKKRLDEQKTENEQLRSKAEILKKENKKIELEKNDYNSKLIFSTEEQYLERIETLDERLKDYSKKLRVNKKEFVPLDKVFRTYENSQKKLRRREAIVAKQKVNLFGVSTTEINSEKEEALNKQIQILEGLKSSVKDYEGVMDKNKKIYPILKNQNEMLTNNINSLKKDIDLLKENYKRFKESK